MIEPDDQPGELTSAAPSSSPDPDGPIERSSEPAAQPATVAIVAADAPRELGPTAGTSRHRAVLMVAAAALTVVVLAGATLIALMKTVTITVDGQSATVTTLAGSVSGALDAAHLTIAEHDTMAPAAGESIAAGSTIVINRGRLLRLTIDGQQVALWTTAQTVAAALDEIGRNPANYRLSADRSRQIPLDGLAVNADTLHTITVDDRGTRRSLASVAMTVSDFLAAQHITLGPNDRVSPAADTMMTGDTQLTIITLPTVTLTDGTGPATPIVSAAATVGDLLTAAGVAVGAQDIVTAPLDAPLSEGLQIGITRVSSAQVTETVAVAQPADQTVKDATVAKGTTTIAQVGRPGQQVVVYEVVLTNGVETSRTEASRTDSVPALPTVRHVGTKVAAKVAATPPPVVAAATTNAAPPPAPSTPPPPAGGTTEHVGNQVFFHDFEYGVNWDALAKCESTNNPRAINPSGKYTGLFQFDDRTWHGVGGSGRSYDAPPEEQLMRAKLLYLARGLQPWACGWAGRT